MTKFTEEQLAYLEANVEMECYPTKGWVLKTVKCDIEGSIEGDVIGNINGDVFGSILGFVGGDIEDGVGGSVFGDIEGFDPRTVRPRSGRPYTIITRSGCPFCEDAEDDLFSLREPFKTYTLDSTNNKWLLTLVKQAGHTTVPQIFAPDGMYIGGYTELKGHLGID